MHYLHLLMRPACRTCKASCMHKGHPFSAAFFSSLPIDDASSGRRELQYLLSLMEEGKEKLGGGGEESRGAPPKDDGKLITGRKMMSLEHWPDIRIRTEVITNNTPLMEKRAISDVHTIEDTDWSFFSRAFFNPAAMTRKRSGVPDLTTPNSHNLISDMMIEERQDQDSFDKLLQRHLMPSTPASQTRTVEMTFEKLGGILRKVSIQRASASIEGEAQDRDILYKEDTVEDCDVHMKDVEFGCSKSKSLTLVLGKAFGFLSPSTPPVKETIMSGPSLQEEQVKEKAQLAGSEEIPFQPQSIPSQPRVMILSGRNLHLLSNHLLDKICKIYGVEQKGTRFKIERQLCKAFKEKLSKEPESCIGIEHLSQDPEQSLKPYLRHKQISARNNSGEWTDEEDERLSTTVGQLQSARQKATQRVLEWLITINGEPVGEEGIALDEHVQLWEMISNELAMGRTASACRKRWLILQRIRGMHDLCKEEQKR